MDIRTSDAARELGRLGGHATARKLSSEERTANATHAAMTRWERVRIVNREAMRGAKQQACQQEQKT